jgi:hypothetical protein
MVAKWIPACAGMTKEEILSENRIELLLELLKFYTELNYGRNKKSYWSISGFFSKEKR